MSVMAFTTVSMAPETWELHAPCDCKQVRTHPPGEHDARLFVPTLTTPLELLGESDDDAG
jgi:hypothetical protein